MGEKTRCNMLFLMKWKCLDAARVDAFTLFGSMDEAADAAEMGPNVKLHGRYHRLGNSGGWLVAEAANASDVLNWVYNWSEGYAISTLRLSPTTTSPARSSR